MSEYLVLQTKAPGKKRASEQTTGIRVLLVSDNIEDIEILCHAMEHAAMHADVCSDMDSATRKLCHSKFEAMVVDLKDETRALELIKKPRGMTSHRALLVLAILSDSHQMPSAFRAGASFALVKPFAQGILMHTLKAAYPLMVRERRRSYRCPMQIPVRVSTNTHSDFAANSINISEGGMALASSVILRVGERITIKFTLPETENLARINGEVCWTDDTGRVGLEFVQVPATVSEQLQSWLAARLEECLPC
jgi:DNA-binding response OmpR family regulator